MNPLDEFSDAVELPAHPDDALDAEQAAIAAVLCDDTGRHAAVARMAEVITSADFTHPGNAEVWAAVEAVHGREEFVDSATIAEELTSRGRTKGLKHLGELVSLNVDPSRCEQYARIVAERAYLRGVLAQVRVALEAGKRSGSPLTLASNVRAALAEIPAGVRGRRDDSIHSAIQETLAEIETTMVAAAQGVSVAAQWGVLALDGGMVGSTWAEGAIGGLFAGKLYLLGGIPGAGKTQLAWCATLATARGNGITPGRRVLVFSLEMSRVDICKRLAGQMCGISEARIERGRINAVEMNEIFKAMETLADLPIEIIGNCRTLETIRARTLAARAQGDVALVVVDFLQLAEVERVYRDENKADAARIYGLKALAMEARVAMLAITSMTKAAQVQAAERKVDTTGAMGSGSGYAADVVAFLVRTNPKEANTSANILFAITKSRTSDAQEVHLRANLARGVFETTAAPPREGAFPETAGDDREDPRYRDD